MQAEVTSSVDARRAPRAQRRPLRIAIVYIAMVVLPTVIPVVLLREAALGGAVPEPKSSGASLSRLLFALATMIGLCAAAGAVARRYGQPAVVGEILVGILMGPSLFGVVWPEAFKALFSAATVAQIGPLAQLG